VPRGLTLRTEHSTEQLIHLFQIKLAINRDISPVRHEQTGLSNENTLFSLIGMGEFLRNVK